MKDKELREEFIELMVSFGGCNGAHDEECVYQDAHKRIYWEKHEATEFLDQALKAKEEEVRKEIADEIIDKYCNNHGGEIRFLRSVFWDEKDGAEKIINTILKKGKDGK